MRPGKPVIIVLVLLAALVACNKKAATSGQSATLTLKDGSTVMGTITHSDTSSVTVQLASGVISTYPVSQVASINYNPTSAPASNDPQGQNAGQQQPAAAAPPPGDSSAPPAAPPNAPPEPQYTPAATYQTIPAGTTIAVRTDQAIDSRTAGPGQTFSGTITRGIADSAGQLAIPRGSGAILVIRGVREQGRIEGRSELAVDVAAVQVGGRRYRLETTDFVEKGRESIGANSRTARFAGGGGLFGTILGAVAGGGKGAAIGALSGAAAGAATEDLTRGRPVRIPAEAVLYFRLEAPIHIREMQ